MALWIFCITNSLIYEYGLIMATSVVYILNFFKNIYLFINNYLVPFNVNAPPLRYNTLMPAFFPILEILLKRALCYCQQLLLRFFFYLLNRSKTLSIGMIKLWFQWHIYTSMIRHQLWPFWANLGPCWTLSTSPEQCPCNVVFAQNLTILKQSTLPYVSCLKHP